MKIWCRAQWPTQVRTAVGCATEPLFARAWIDSVTPSRGIAAPFTVEIGYGPADVPPSHSAWKWTSAIYNRAFAGDGNNDEFMAALTPLVEGDWRWSARVRINDHTVAYAENTLSLTVYPRGTLTLATLNLRGLMDHWPKRAPVVFDALRRLRPDVVALQECGVAPNGESNLASLLSALPQPVQSYHAISHRAFDQYDEGVALIVASPNTVAEWHVVDLPRGDFPRKLLVAHVRTNQGPLLMGCTHLDLHRKEVRVVQAEAIAKAVHEQALWAERLMIGGDFNDPAPGSVGSVFRAVGWCDVWEALQPNRPGHTFPSHAPAMRIDYLWWRGNQDGFRPIRVETFLAEPRHGIYGSDHLGVVTTIAG